MNLFWWRKRNEGFEWRDYVRTTILVRREQRRQKLKDVQHAAAEHLKDAGQRGLDAGLSGVRNAGSGIRSAAGASGALFGRAVRTAVPAIGTAVIAAGRGLATGARGAWTGVRTVGEQVGRPLSPLLEPALSFAREPKVSLALKATALFAGLGAAYRAWAFGFDADARVAAALSAVAAIVLLLAFLTDPYRPARSAALPRRGRASEVRESLIERLRAGDMSFPTTARLEPRTVGVATLGVVAVAAVGLTAAHLMGAKPWTEAGSRAVTTGALPASDTPKLEGRAVALTGDMLRIGGKDVVLDGIAAPEVGQSCQRKGGKWRCGIAAKDALAGLVRGRRISCEIVDTTDSGLKTVRCTAGGNDLAGKLVRAGYVFTTGGFMGRYAGLESDAANEKLGLWSGEAERPEDWRAKRWDEARRTAPEGCPIKGRIRSGARTYVLPWSPSYDSIELSTAKGERWFCSESEAQDAGWSRSAPS